MNLSNAVRYALKVSFAVLTAFFANIYFSSSHEPWLLLTTFCVTAESRNTPIRHALLVIVIIFAGLFTESILSSYFPAANIWLGLLLLISGAIFLLNDTWKHNFRVSIVLFVLIITIALWWSNPSTMLRERILDSSIGGLIGLLFTIFIFPFNPNKAFRQGIITVLHALHDYALNPCESKKINVQKALISPHYPVWVYEVGFNPGLRSGLRFFLVHFEQIIDLYFAFEDYAAYEKEQLSAADFAEFQLASDNNAKLIAELSNYFNEQKIPQTDLDFISDIAAMEEVTRKLIPPSETLIDIAPQYIHVIGFAQTIKDIRKKLLQLLLSLTSSR